MLILTPCHHPSLLKLLLSWGQTTATLPAVAAAGVVTAGVAAAIAAAIADAIATAIATAV